MAMTWHARNRRRRNAARAERHFCQFEFRREPYYEGDPHYSATKKQCPRGGAPCYLAAYSEQPDEYLCREHITIGGFCAGCGIFCAGIESFDFGNFPGWCDNCALELRDQWEEEKDDGDDYGYDYWEEAAI